MLCLSISDPDHTVAQGRTLKKGQEEREVEVTEKVEKKQRH
jgi:hypothetical protein